MRITEEGIDDFMHTFDRYSTWIAWGIIIGSILAMILIYCLPR